MTSIPHTIAFTGPYLACTMHLRKLGFDASNTGWHHPDGRVSFLDDAPGGVGCVVLVVQPRTNEREEV